MAKTKEKQYKAPNLVGKTLEEVLRDQMDMVPGCHWHIRVTKRDGIHYPVTRDYRTDRINLHVSDGKVTYQDVG